MAPIRMVICDKCGKLFQTSESIDVCDECCKKKDEPEEIDSSVLDPIIIDGDEDAACPQLFQRFLHGAVGMFQLHNIASFFAFKNRFRPEIPM